MSNYSVQASAAVRKLVPSAGERGWQLQLGLAATGLVALAAWRCTVIYAWGVHLQGGGGCTVTGGHLGEFTVVPDNGAVAAGGRAVVAVRVHGTNAAPQAVQFTATTAGGLPVWVRCGTAAVRDHDGTSTTATGDTWPQVSAMRRGRNAVAPWHDWAAPAPAHPIEFRFDADVADAPQVARRVNDQLRGLARGGLVLWPGARPGPWTTPACPPTGIQPT